MRIDINYRDGAYKKFSVDFPQGALADTLPISKETLRVSDDGISYVPLVGIPSRNSVRWVSAMARARRLRPPLPEDGKAVFASGDQVVEVTLVGPEEVADVESVGVDGVSFWSRDSSGRLVPSEHDADGGIEPDDGLDYTQYQPNPCSYQHDSLDRQGGHGIDYGYGRI